MNREKALFVCYPRCSTCKKAKEWLTAQGIDFEERNIVENTPTKDELKKWFDKSKLPISRLFNTSGIKYREAGLKDTVKNASEEELLQILSTDGMLIKRPILIKGDNAFFGFKEETWGKSKE